MARKLKTYQTSLGFFDQAIAAPSMKAALEAWGADSNLFHQGAAKETDDPDVVAATMAKPGVVLKRPAGSTGPSANMPNCRRTWTTRRVAGREAAGVGAEATSGCQDQRQGCRRKAAAAVRAGATASRAERRKEEAAREKERASAGSSGRESAGGAGRRAAGAYGTVGNIWKRSGATSRQRIEAEDRRVGKREGEARRRPCSRARE